MSPRQSYLLPILALCCFAAAEAGMYRWVDENGVTVYSQTPPPDRQSVSIAAPPPPARNSQDTTGVLEEQMKKFQDRRDLKTENAERQAETDALQAKRDQDCQAARHNMTILEGPPRKLISTPDGQYHRLDPEERQEQIDKAQKLIDEYCSDE